MICVCCESSLPSDADLCPECGQAPLLDGRFRLERTLGSGATGVVYRAVQLATGRPVAIKATPISRDSSDQLTRLVEREARVLRQLDHPGIPAYLDQVIAGRGRARSLYLVVELVEGQTLAEELEGHRYSEREVLGILADLSDILAYLHELSPPVVHRDLKLSNILRRAEGGSLALVDFGSVRDALRDAQLGGNTVVGTFGFMAPEQFRGHAEPATDLWGLGAVAVALLSREDPASLFDRGGHFGWEPTVRLSPSATALVRQLLQEDPAARPGSAREVARRCRAIAAGTHPEPPPLAAPSSATPRPVRLAERTQGPAPELVFNEALAPSPEAGLGRRSSRVRGPALTVVAMGVLVLGLGLTLALFGGFLAVRSPSPPAVPVPVRAPEVPAVPEAPVLPGPDADLAPAEPTECEWSAEGLDFSGPVVEGQVVDRQTPSFPAELRGRQGPVEAQCLVHWVVDKEGAPLGLEVAGEDSCTMPFRRSVCEVGQGWSFKPSEDNLGQVQEVEVRFRRN